MIKNTAQGLASLGRNGDTVLVHMSPDEVAGLQGLALAQGGSLTINPHTGLPEAFNLKSLLPMVIGAVLTPLTGGIINPMTAGLLVGAAEGVRKKDIGAGLMAGLSAYGGAGLGSALAGLGAKAATAAAPSIAQGATTGLGAGTTTGALGSGAFGASAANTAGALPIGGLMQGINVAGQSAAAPIVQQAAKAATEEAIKRGTLQTLGQQLAKDEGAKAFGKAAWEGTKDLFTRSGAAGELGASLGGRGMLAAATPILQASMEPTEFTPMTPEASEYYQTTYDPYTQTFSPGRFTREYPYAEGGAVDSLSEYIKRVNESRVGPQISKQSAEMAARSAAPRGEAPISIGEMVSVGDTKLPAGTTTRHVDKGWYDVYNPQGIRSGILKPGGSSGIFVPIEMGTFGKYRFDPATRGTTKMATGGLSGLGNYSDGGQLLDGPGDGMSDDIPAVINGEEPQKAALADGEFVVPADVVSHIGNGSTKAGADKLYMMMDRVRKARTGRTKQAPEIDSERYLPA